MTRRSILRTAAAIGAPSLGAASQTGLTPCGPTSPILRVASSRGSIQLRWKEPAPSLCNGRMRLRSAPGSRVPERWSCGFRVTTIRNGGSIAERLRAAGIDWALCGENIFMEKGWDDPGKLRRSCSGGTAPGHQANLLNPRIYPHTGVGLAQGPDRAWFVTQIFLEQPPSARVRHSQ